MKRLLQQHCNQRYSPANREERCGAAAVEFAVMLPLFLMISLGTFEMGNALEVSHILESSVREGGRLVGMDWDDIIPDGQTPNQKS